MLCSYNCINRAESLKGSGFNKTERTIVKSETFAPIPMAISTIEANPNPGVRASARAAMRRLCTAVSRLFQLQVSPACSRRSAGLPNALSAACRASIRPIPAAMFSAVSSEVKVEFPVKTLQLSFATEEHSQSHPQLVP